MTAFSLGAVLSTTTGRLLCDFSEVHELLDYMTGDTLFTHQLPRACEAVAPRILEQHPDLAAIVVPEDLSGAEPVAAWMAETTKVYGATRDLTPLVDEDWTQIDPLAEFAMVAPGKPVIVIGPDGEVSDVD